MNSLSKFIFNDCEIRTLLNEDGIIECVAKDVAVALGYKDTINAIKRHCNKDGVAKRHLIDSKGRTQLVQCINEPNIYRLIAHSKLPNAVKFEKWIYEEVIPSIRKNGGYIPVQSTTEQVYALVEEHARERYALIQTIREQALAIDIMKPSGSFGETSQCNNKPRTQLIPSYFRSPSGENADGLSEVIQLLLPLFNVIENSKNKQIQAGGN